MNLRQILICVSFFVITSNGKLENLKICVIGNPKARLTHTAKYCDLLARSKRTPVSCVFAVDRLECLKAVTRRKADFTVLDAEDLYFSTLWDESTVLVVSEIRSVKKYPFEYGAVTVVRNSLNLTSVEDLRGTKLCHPGLGERNNLFAQYFEERVAPPNCDSEFTVYEDRIKTTSNFFGAACKAGSWVADEAEDARLKRKYSNMCSLCDNQDCRQGDKYSGSGGSMLCLTDGVGDVVWAKYSDVRIHFKLAMATPLPSTSEYSFLCEDGSLLPLTQSEPCYWLARPWQVVGANRKSATNVQKVLDQLGDTESNEWEDNLFQVIESYMEYIQNLAVSKVPEDYLTSFPGYLSASSMSQANCKPKHTVKFCTASTIDQRKCVWISKAAEAYTIQPAIECFQKSSVEDCFNSITKEESDVVVIRPDFEFDAIMNYNLKNLIYEAPKEQKDSYLLSAVVKRNSDIKKLSDFSSKRACFTKVNGIGWNSALAALQEEYMIDSQCNGKESLQELFKEVCVSSKNDEDIPICCGKDNSTGNEETDTFRCLVNDGCDVAFVGKDTLYKNTDGNNVESWAKDLRSTEFREVCRKEKSSECHWFWSYPGHVMVSSNVNHTNKHKEAFDVIKRLGQYFHKGPKNDNPMLEIFAPFSQANNVLFQDTSVRFVRSDFWEQPNNYNIVIDRIRQCSACSIVKPLHSFFLIIIGTYLLIT